MVLRTHLVEASIINTHSPFPILLFTRTGLASQSKLYTSLMNPAARSLAISSPMALCLSSSKRRRHCLAGFEPKTRCSVCSVTSLGMPGMSEGFHVKTSRLARRKSASSLSYLDGSLVPIHTFLVGLLGSISTTLVSSVRWKELEEVSSL